MAPSKDICVAHFAGSWTPALVSLSSPRCSTEAVRPGCPHAHNRDTDFQQGALFSLLTHILSPLRMVDSAQGSVARTGGGRL